MLDALTFRLLAPDGCPPTRLIGKSLALFEESLGSLDKGGVPTSVFETLTSARSYVAAFHFRSLLDADHQFRGFEPFSKHLLAIKETGEPEAFPLYRSLGLPLVKVSGLVIAIRMRASPLALELAVLPISLARHTDGMKALALLLLRLTGGLACTDALGAPTSAWLVAGRIGRPKAPLLVAGHTLPRGYSILASDKSLKVGRLVEPKPVDAVKSVDLNVVGTDPYAPTWTGAVARFEGDMATLSNARQHFQKHVVLGQEWTPKEVPTVDAYLKKAVELADGGDYEFLQPANQAIVKYSATSNALAIANRSTGALKTYFRPDDAGYVLRKVRSNTWTAPPIGGVVLYARPALPEDAELADRLTTWEALVAEAMSAAAALALAPEERYWPVAVALAASTRVERERHSLLSLYVPDARQGEVEARLIEAEQVNGALEAIFRAEPRRGRLGLLLEGCSVYLESAARTAFESEEGRANFADLVEVFSDAILAVGPESWFEREISSDCQVGLKAHSAAWRALATC